MLETTRRRPGCLKAEAAGPWCKLCSATATTYLTYLAFGNEKTCHIDFGPPAGAAAPQTPRFILGQQPCFILGGSAPQTSQLEANKTGQRLAMFRLLNQRFRSRNLFWADFGRKPRVNGQTRSQPARAFALWYRFWPIRASFTAEAGSCRPARGPEAQ